MTNRDKLSIMSNKELAELLEGDCAICTYRGNGDGRCYSSVPPCIMGIKKWLESEVNEDD